MVASRSESEVSLAELAPHKDAFIVLVELSKLSKPVQLDEFARSRRVDLRAVISAIEILHGLGLVARRGKAWIATDESCDALRMLEETLSTELAEAEANEPRQTSDDRTAFLTIENSNLSGTNNGAAPWEVIIKSINKTEMTVTKTSVANASTPASPRRIVAPEAETVASPVNNYL